MELGDYAKDSQASIECRMSSTQCSDNRLLRIVAIVQTHWTREDYLLFPRIVGTKSRRLSAPDNRSVSTGHPLCSNWTARGLTCLLLIAVAALTPWDLGAQQENVTIANDSGLPDAPSGVESGAAADPGPSTQKAPATVCGTVLDANGAVVQGARVALSGPAPGDNRVLDTGDNGQFSFTGLPPGKFALTVSGPGWGTYAAPDIHLAAGEFHIVPQVTLPLAAAITEVRVVGDREELAQEQVQIAMQQRVLGVFPNFYSSYDWHAPAMGTKQKYQLAFRSLIDPVTFMGVGGVAGLEQVNNRFPEYGGGALGYTKRFGAAYADDVSGRFLGSAVFPSLFHQDPRYFYRGSGSKRSRAFYAMSAAVMARSDGGRWEPNYSYILGSFAAGGISNLYYPSSSRGVSLTVTNGLIDIAAHAGTNLVREFVLKRFTTRANGATDVQP